MNRPPFYFTPYGRLTRAEPIASLRQYAQRKECDGVFYRNYAGEPRFAHKNALDEDGIYIVLPTDGPVSRDEAVRLARARWSYCVATLRAALLGVAGIIYQASSGEVKLHVNDMTSAVRD